MAEFYDAIAGLFLGGLSVYGFFWNKARAQKQDDEKLNNLIHSENEKQNAQTSEQNDTQHKRLNHVAEELKDVQFELGYSKGYRNGHKDGLTEARAQSAEARSTALAINKT